MLLLFLLFCKIEMVRRNTQQVTEFCVFTDELCHWKIRLRSLSISLFSCKHKTPGLSYTRQTLSQTDIYFSPLSLFGDGFGCVLLETSQCIVQAGLKLNLSLPGMQELQLSPANTGHLLISASSVPGLQAPAAFCFYFDGEMGLNSYLVRQALC